MISESVNGGRAFDATSIERVYEVAIGGQPAAIDAALAAYPRSARLRDPGAIALRAMQHILDGDVKGGVALLKRAVEHATDDVRPYLIDLLVPLLVSLDDVAGAEDLLEREKHVPPALRAAFLSARATVCAYKGDDDASAEIGRRALDEGRGLDDPQVVARVVQRVALAAFYRGDFAEADDLALESARAFERIGAHLRAAQAYSILYIIAAGWRGDPDLAWYYAGKIATSGKLANDLSMQNHGLVAQIEIAAEAGDHKRLGSTRTRLLANRLNEQYREGFSFALAEALFQGWAGNFEGARAIIAGWRNVADRSPAQRAMCEALLALFALGRWNVEEARKHMRSAIHLTAERSGAEPFWDAHRRRCARIMAAAACIVAGDPSRGRKALTKTFDPDQHFARIMTERGMSEEETPPLMRGYARLVNAVVAAASKCRPQLGLTTTELDVLRALPTGATVAAIARSFGKSPNTVERQITSIYSKLQVSNRAQAIQRARDLGLHA
jgi:ATP/maltotriose-dependent transcriptional regulator MalT